MLGDWIQPDPAPTEADAAATAFERVVEADVFASLPPIAEPAETPLAASPIANGAAEGKANSPEPQSERRRLRGLIRQMRATMDEA
jgi:hypothetical protein